MVEKPAGSGSFTAAHPGRVGSWHRVGGLVETGDGGYWLATTIVDTVFSVTGTGRLSRTGPLAAVANCTRTSPGVWPGTGRELVTGVGGVTATPWFPTVTPIAINVSEANLPLSEFCSSCASGLTAVPGLHGVRRSNDAAFSWTSVSGATAYDLWYVTLAEDIDRARQGDPAAIPVAGCAPPSPATSPDCKDSGALVRSPSLFFYQVRAVCGGAEGP